MSQSNSAATDQQHLISQLSRRIHGMERSAVHARAHQNTREPISTGVDSLDQLSPNGGILPGSLWEWLATSDGSGAATMAVAVAAQVQGRQQVSTDLEVRRTLVIVDRHHEVYPPALSTWGVDLEHTVIIQPDDARQALWALEQSLRCRGVAVTIGWVDQIGDHAFRRLQLATQRGGGFGMLIRSVRYRRSVSWADARLLVRPVRVRRDGENWRTRDRETERQGDPSSGHLPLSPSPHLARLRVELVSHKGPVVSDRASVQSLGPSFIEVDVDDHTGYVRDVPRLASATRAG